MPGAVLPRTYAVRVTERVLAGQHAVLQLTPCVPVASATDECRPATNRLGGIRAQAIAHPRQRKAPPLALFQNADGRQRAQQAVQRGRVCLRLRGEIVAVTGPAREQVGDPKRRGDVNRLRYLIAVDEAT